VPPGDAAQLQGPGSGRRTARRWTCGNYDGSRGHGPVNGGLPGSYEDYEPGYFPEPTGRGPDQRIDALFPERRRSAPAKETRLKQAQGKATRARRCWWFSTAIICTRSGPSAVWSPARDRSTAGR